MKASILLLLVLMTAATLSAQQSGMYANSATPIWDRLWSKAGKAHAVSIPSPNNSSVLIASSYDDADTGVELKLEREGNRLWSQKVSPGVGIEAAWAPDSTAFFVTTSDGGRNGFYELVVYLVNQDAVKARDLTPTIREAFGHPVKCQWEEPPNVAGVKWMPNSKELIAVAEIVAHSNCDSEGTFRAYRIALPAGHIVGSYDQIEAKRLFRGDLGSEIRNAPDHCINRPAACWQPFNHGSTK